MELNQISDQYINRKTPAKLQGVLDENMSILFNAAITKAGYPDRLVSVEELKDGIKSIITYHKNYFNALRPGKLASQAGLSFTCDYLESAQTPSYPSGHTAQAFYLAHSLSAEYPTLENVFYDLAEMISQSRIDRGVHFPSDIDGGKMLADKLFFGDEGGHNK
jgi:hypothetical protein